MLRQMIFDLRNVFNFYSKYTVLHKLDPRFKMIYVVFTIVTAALLNNITALVFLILINFALVTIGKIPLNRVLSAIRSLLLFFIVILFLNLILKIILGGLTLTMESLITIFYYIGTTIARLLLVTLSIMVLMNTTTPREIVQGLSFFGLSCQYLYSIVLLFRFIPIVFDEALNIYDAQRSRGIELEKASTKEKIKRLKSIVLPAFICSLLRAVDLYEALELKGFGYSRKRTFYTQLKITRIDLLFISLIFATYSICLIFQ
ncbi:MAG: energy-coupling factor transporter transmembrane component T [Desulfurococcaceae archaeon]